MARLRAENPEKYKSYNAAYRIKNLDKIKAYQINKKTNTLKPNKQTDAERKEKHRLKMAKLRSKDPEKYKASAARYQREKQKSDPVYAMCKRFRSRLYLALKSKGYKKQSPTEVMLGCSYAKFIKHIENQFTEGMNWDNRSEWHLDHIIPLSCATTIEGIEKLSHYSNIRPLWATDNLAKSDNLVLH